MRIIVFALAGALLFGCGSSEESHADMPVEYAFVSDTSFYVSLHHGDSLSIGKLDEAGNFFPDKNFVKVRGPLSHCPNSVLINSRGVKNERVYEYRSARIIPGVLDGSGNFVPDLDGKIISFKDYRYSKDARRIYNLPGRFVKKGGEDDPAKE